MVKECGGIGPARSGRRVPEGNKGASSSRYRGGGCSGNDTRDGSPGEKHARTRIIAWEDEHVVAMAITWEHVSAVGAAARDRGGPNTAPYNDPPGIVKYIVDTGATLHLVGDPTLLENARIISMRVRNFNGNIAYATLMGSITIYVRRHNKEGFLAITLDTVYYVKGCTRNLISWPCMMRSGAVMHLEPGNCSAKLKMADNTSENLHIHDRSLLEIHAYPLEFVRARKQELMQSTALVENKSSALVENLASKREDTELRVELLGDPSGVYPTTSESRLKQAARAQELINDYALGTLHWRKMKTSPTGVTYEQAHQMLGHPGQSIMMMLPAALNFRPHTQYYQGPKRKCATCALANAKRAAPVRRPEYEIKNSPTKFGELVATDAAGPINPPGIRGEKYVCIFVDGWSRYIVVYPMVKPGDYPAKLAEYRRNFMQGRLSRMHMDNDAKKFLGTTLTAAGIQVTSIVAGESQQNGLAERAIQSVEIVARALQENGGAPECLFINSMQVAGVLLRFVPRRVLGNRSPYQLANGKEPGFPLGMQPLYCAVYVLNIAAKKNQSRGRFGIHMGYAHTDSLAAHCGDYTVLIIDEMKIVKVAAANCNFDPSLFPFKEQAEKSYHMGERTRSRQPGREPINGSVLYWKPPLYVVLLDDGQLVHVTEDRLVLMIQAFNTQQFKAPIEVPVFQSFGQTTAPERARLEGAGVIEDDLPQVSELQDLQAKTLHDGGVEEMKNDSTEPPSTDQVQDTDEEMTAPSRDSGGPNVKNKYKNMTIEDFDNSRDYRGLMLPVVNGRKHKAGDHVLLPPFFWGNEFEHRQESLAVIKSAYKTPASRKRRQQFPNMKFTNMVTFYTGDSAEKAIPWEICSDDVQKFGKILKASEYYALTDLESVSVALAAQHLKEVVPMCVEHTAGEAPEAWSLMSGIDDHLPEYAELAAHTECNEVWCMSHEPEVNQFTGVGYQQVDRKQEAEAWSIQDFIQSLGGAEVERIKLDTTPDPVNDEEANNHKYKEKWAEAREAEVNALLEKKVLRECTAAEVADLRRRNIKPLSTRGVYKTKVNADGTINKFKYRLVVRGFMQIEGKHYVADNVESPTVHSVSFKSFLAMANQRDLAIDQWDVNNAFMQGEFRENETLYVQLPPNMGGTICRLLKPLYGIKQAAQNFYNALEKELEKFGFEKSNVDACLWKYEKDGVVMNLISHVDDILCSYDDKDEDALKVYGDFTKAFGKRFHFENNGPVHHYLGMEIIYNRAKGTISLVQTAYLQRVLQRFGRKTSSKFSNTPSDPSVDLSSEEDDLFYDDHNPPFKNLREVVGCLIYASTGTRPDISYAVSVLASHVNNPAKKHHQAAGRLLKYLGGSLDYGITYTRSENNEDPWRVYAHSDADFAQDARTRRSRSGKIIMMCGGPMLWGSFLQGTVALSSTESEYTAIVHLGQEIGYMSRILEFLGIQLTGPMKVYCDNSSTIRIAVDRFKMRRTRHIQVKFFKLQEWVENKTIEILKVPSEDNLADWFTKGTMLVKNFMKCRDVVLTRVASSALPDN